ncbi:ArsR/SmtB family transcription factor [Nocardiopsis kunsanensis]|uniref:Transcriptional regulator n=1 Tax=Nocardiopsis kunsanensis TaxID=141693 RepID=A0A918XD90_9ACTN|nr:metalloregulator ArsR/SmtB family transcription factor [Nocardiopsis kunsanensis]GHD26629.1 transcriptional regulator [Nocardiopsis kunsanensis]
MNTPTTTALAALADGTRWEVLARLGREPASASALARELPVSRQAIVKHLEVLVGAGLVVSRRRGREVVHVAVGERLSSLGRDLERIGRGWNDRLAAFEETAGEQH